VFEGVVVEPTVLPADAKQVRIVLGDHREPGIRRVFGDEYHRVSVRRCRVGGDAQRHVVV
jgi:hypothetical protein